MSHKHLTKDTELVGRIARAIPQISRCQVSHTVMATSKDSWVFLPRPEIALKTGAVNFLFSKFSKFSAFWPLGVYIICVESLFCRMASCILAVRWHWSHVRCMNSHPTTQDLWGRKPGRVCLSQGCSYCWLGVQVPLLGVEETRWVHQCDGCSYFWHSKHDLPLCLWTQKPTANGFGPS